MNEPYISTHMGIHKLIHFVKESKSFDQEGIEIICYPLKGFNIGNVYPMQESEKDTCYSDEIGNLTQWYYNTKHFDDYDNTWTGEGRVDRNDSWSWSDNIKPYNDIKIDVPLFTRLMIFQ